MQEQMKNLLALAERRGASYAGKSFLTPDLYGKGYRFGSDAVNLAADATIAGALGSFFYDDEGVPAQRTPLVEKGIFKNYLTSRETAVEYGGTFNSSMKAMNWANFPLIRMTNINLEPGDWSLAEMIKDWWFTFTMLIPAVKTHHFT